MISFPVIVILLMAHFIGDFVLQKDSWAKNKSKSTEALSKHVGTYTLTLFLFSLLIFPPVVAFIFASMNFVFHYWTDYVTSRRTSKLCAEGRVHDFFVVVGYDQLLHYIILFGLYLLYSTM